MSGVRRRALWLAAAASAAVVPGSALPQSSRPGQAVVTSLTLFAGTGSGLWRTRDWGHTWEKVRSGVLDEVGAVRTVLPIGPRVYVGADRGLFVSDDFGETWARGGFDGPVLGVLPSRYAAADPTVLVGTASGLVKSVDGGRTFHPTALQGASVHRIEWPGPALVLATGRGVLVSTDGGGSFAPAGTGLPEGPVQALALSAYFMVDPVMFAAVGSQGVFRSSDGGKTWSASGLQERTVTDLVWFGPLLYAVTDQGLYRSADAGKRWERFGEGLAQRRLDRLLFPLAPDSGTEVFLSTDRGIYHSGDGGTYWRPSGLDREEILCLATFPPPERTPARPRWPVRCAKAHGLGNDFLLVGAGLAPADLPAWVRRICDRHLGIGADGVLLYEVADGEVRMRLVNADGGDAEISGNGLRCLAAYVVRQGWLPPRHVVRTAAGPRAVEVQQVHGARYRVTTDLGPPRLASADVPMTIDPPRDRVVDFPLEVAGQVLRVTATSLGNPHCALFLEAPAEDLLVTTLGPALEHHPAFPRRTNVEFVTVTARDQIRVRFWERGVGPTSASGTGAASAAVAAILTGRADRRLRVVCDGGVLDVEWFEAGSVRQVGEVEVLFEAEWLVT
jgi:diaminopimelate epimerase